MAILTGVIIAPIAFLVVYSLSASGEERKEYSYARAEIPIQNPRKKKFNYKARVRYNEEEVQIYGGKPKNVGWKTVKSDKLEQTIRKQL